MKIMSYQIIYRVSKESTTKIRMLDAIWCGLQRASDGSYDVLYSTIYMYVKDAVDVGV